MRRATMARNREAVSVKTVVARRRAQRTELIDRARLFATSLDRSLEVVAAVVVGSVARGDFNLWSDVDLLIVAGHLPDRLLDRLEALGRPPPWVEPIVWAPTEWETALRRRNPLAVEAIDRGVWVVGSASDLPAPGGAESSEST